MSAGELLILTTTFPDRAAAERVTLLLVDGGLAVCGQVGAELKSYYNWQGKLQQVTEVGVTYKVLPERFDLCVGELKLQHPHDVPQIVAWTSGFVGREYLDWALGAGR